MIGAVDSLDPPRHLGGGDALAPDRARSGDSGGDEAEAAAGAGRFDRRFGRRPRQHHGRIELTLVAVEIDLGARRIGDQSRRSALDRAPDQAVDEPVLKAFEPGARESRGREQPVTVELATATLGVAPFKRKIEEAPWLAEGKFKLKQKGIRGYSIRKTRTIALPGGDRRVEVTTDVYPPTFEIYLVPPGSDADTLLPPLVTDEDARTASNDAPEAPASTGALPAHGAD